MHGLVQVAAGDVEVPLHLVERTVGHDEAEPSGMGGDAADHEVHAIRKAESVAACLDEVPSAYQIGQEPLEGCALVAWNLQALKHLARRGRVVDRVADQREQLLVIQHDVMLVQRDRRSGIGARRSVRDDRISRPSRMQVLGQLGPQTNEPLGYGPGPERRAPSAGGCFFQPTPPRCSLLIV